MNMSGYKKKARNIGRGTFLAMALFFFMLPTLATAGDVKDYVPLAPLPGTYCPPGTTDPTCTNVSSGGTTLGRYLPGLFKLGIGIAGVLAVIMIMIGGVEYMMSESITSKGAGKDKMRDAIIGLLLAMGAWIILNTINPNLVDTETTPAPLTPVAKQYYAFEVREGLSYSYVAAMWFYDYHTKEDAKTRTSAGFTKELCISTAIFNQTHGFNQIIDRGCYINAVGNPPKVETENFDIGNLDACITSVTAKEESNKAIITRGCAPGKTQDDKSVGGPYSDLQSCLYATGLSTEKPPQPPPLPEKLQAPPSGATYSCIAS